MAPQSASNSTTNSGIQKLSNGESVIPASTRADGTVRKEIRVKPGYRPPEDVEVYKNRTAEAWKNRGKSGVPGAEGLVSDKKDVAQSAPANKNAKRREARKRAAAAAQEDGEGTEEGATDEQGTQTKNDVREVKEEPMDPEAEKAKEARKLAKKLRQAHELQAKKDKGDSLLPEQFAKVIKINELIRQLDILGFDSEGEPKTEETIK